MCHVPITMSPELTKSPRHSHSRDIAATEKKTKQAANFLRRCMFAAGSIRAPFSGVEFQIEPAGLRVKFESFPHYDKAADKWQGGPHWLGFFLGLSIGILLAYWVGLSVANWVEVVFISVELAAMLLIGVPDSFWGYLHHVAGGVPDSNQGRETS